MRELTVVTRPGRRARRPGRRGGRARRGPGRGPARRPAHRGRRARRRDRGPRRAASTCRGRDEVARLSSAFNAMTERLAGSRRRQRQLIADSSHELRTPLTSLRTNLEWLMRSEDRGRPLARQQRRQVEQAVLGQVEELEHPDRRARSRWPVTSRSREPRRRRARRGGAARRGARPATAIRRPPLRPAGRALAGAWRRDRARARRAQPARQRAEVLRRPDRGEPEVGAGSPSTTVGPGLPDADQGRRLRAVLARPGRPRAAGLGSRPRDRGRHRRAARRRPSSSPTHRAAEAGSASPSQPSRNSQRSHARPIPEVPSVLDTARRCERARRGGTDETTAHATPRVALLLLALLLTPFVAACGASGDDDPGVATLGDSGDDDEESDDGADAASSEEDLEEQALEFAQCMRENGVPDFPDPQVDGRPDPDGRPRRR